jgi:two-component system aerobic respiration control sensor histidine kinase ArcB
MTARVPRDVMVSTDPALLEQVLVEVVDNAIRFNRAGGTVRVAVDLGRTAAEPGVALVVDDTGHGIARTDLGRIQGWCRRGEQASRLHPTGLGIGLALARRVAEAIGVELAITSTPGSQTRVRLTIPDHGALGPR